ncbi:MAG: cytochrome c oxidase subunit II [Planctomycetota bacterium]|jgi:cytochrome c oxidase subunit 2
MTDITSLFSLLDAAPLASSGPTFWMPEQASTVAPDVDKILRIINWICYVFFFLIIGVMFWFMFKYRRRTHVANTGGPTHNTPLEVTWTVVPLILVIAIFYIGLRGYVNIRTAPQNSYLIDVMGQRWSWTFSYPNGATLTNTLLVPVNRPVKVTMRSDDVLHSLFIPAFRVKQDVVPGKVTDLWFQATKVGEFDLFCAEYCGTQHSQMTGKVVVLDEAEFEVRIEEEAKWIDKVPDENLHLAGVSIYSQCALCHTLDGSVLVAPSFKETWELFHKKTGDGMRPLADGSSVEVNEEYLRSSILAPLDQIAKGYPSSMPPAIGTQLGARRVEAIVQFIMRLDEATDDDWNLNEVNRQDIMVEAQEGE